MAIRGIGTQGVASEIGALGRHENTFTVDRKYLVDSLCRRYEATLEEVEQSINKAEASGVIQEDADGKITLVR